MAETTDEAPGRTDLGAFVHARRVTAPVLPILRPGDRVAVVAPSSPVRAEMLEAGIEEVRRLGLEAVVPDGILARHRFSAGDDARRLAELVGALRDDSVRAVWLARGGYGATPLMRRLDPSSIARAGKILIGESDATALGLAWRAAGMAWLHGPMVAGNLRLGADGYDATSLCAALFGDTSYALTPALTRTLRPGEAAGELWGGCLTLLAALAGTRWLQPPARGLLVLEDVGVKPYQVHRMLVQLRDAGALAGTTGVLLGDFSGCIQHEEQGYDVADVMAELIEDAVGGVPISIGWPIGHASAPHVTLPMGFAATLHSPASGASRLTWQRPSRK